MNTYQVVIRKRVEKSLHKLPKRIQKKLIALKQDLTENGPIQPNWPNYSKLSDGVYHCHLNRSYVACWTHQNKTLTIEVYYVGSREDAPY